LPLSSKNIGIFFGAVFLFIIALNFKNPLILKTTNSSNLSLKNNYNADNATSILNDSVSPAEILPKFERKWEIEEPEISAVSAVALASDSNFILYSKNIFEKRPIASLTKLMTALTAVNYLDLNQDIIIPSDIDFLPKDSMSCGLISGERIKTENLLYCLLVISANDAAVSIAKSIPSFVALMNVKAKSMGLSNTFFEEPTGLSPFNVATAYDIAKLTDFILLNRPIIFKIQKTPEIAVKSRSGQEHHLINFNRFISRSDFKGGKTGYTDEAGGTLSSIFEINKTNIIIVVLGSKNRFEDTLRILEWIKKEYKF